MTALELTIVPATEPSTRLSSAAVDVTPSRMLSSAAVDVTDTPPIWSVVALTVVAVDTPVTNASPTT